MPTLKSLLTGFRYTTQAFILSTLISSYASAEPSAYRVEKQTVLDLKSVFASVESMDVTQGRARIGGTLIELLVDEGDVVEAGQRLALVRDAKQKLQIAAFASKLRSLSAQLTLSKTTLKRISTLHKSGKASQSELDRALTNVDVTSADIATLKLDQAVVKESQAQGDVLAPARGRVLSVNVTLGAVVMPGEPIAEIAADNYILRLLLPERHARFIKKGDTVLVAERGMLDSANTSSRSEQRTGTVSQVYPELDNGRVMADVQVAGLGDFFVGERVRVWVSTDKREAYVIPEDYIHRRYGLSFVYLSDGSEVVIQPGTRLATGIEILSGLKTGDTLRKNPAPRPASSNSAGE
ncbi:MAG: efflux RND transporter periplasmic adaptor subunit [Gammaproteobacteria bacterium]|nr:efflux RND transporter periplasmic adaptor subunit [Gammaproteobacteria bacterium]MBQ0840088.1 efflux RND transporter periplasmic adaptor subunit [Gammaproteobacteria bacterium]